MENYEVIKRMDNWSMQYEFQNNHATKEAIQVDYILYESIDKDSRKHKPLFT